jgi:8-oxo-dGTP pyrophosphatase MutT (NUDIX family)
MVLVVSVTVMKDNKVLLIKENKSTAYNQWNFPSGRIEKYEDILEAAKREVKEETGLEVELLSTTGVYNFVSETNHQVILFHFMGEIKGGKVELPEDEILDSKWMSLEEIMNLRNEHIRHPMVIRQIVDALQKGQFYPTTLFKKKLNE